MYSPCHIIQLALQKKKFHRIFFLCLKISFFHHPKVFISVKLPVQCGTFAFFLAIFFRRQFFPDVRWLLLQITC